MPDDRVPLTGHLEADERFRFIAPMDIEYYFGDTVELVFISDRGCWRYVRFPLRGESQCFTIDVDTKIANDIPVKRGGTVQIQHEDIIMPYRILKFSTSVYTEYNLYIFNEKTQRWDMDYNGKDLADSGGPEKNHQMWFPEDPKTKKSVEGLYKVVFYANHDSFKNCNGYFFIQVGGRAENLVIVRESFSISPNMPQDAGSAATITFDVVNQGRVVHNTRLTVQWENAPAPTYLDVNNFQPGETRKISVTTVYPPKSQHFIAHINPHADMPPDETNWNDNRARWFVSVTFKPPGGNRDGGQMSIKIYDSDNRLISGPPDGVWERETARMEVTIDQAKIDAAFAAVDAEINKAIGEKISEYYSKYSDSVYEAVSVTAAPPAWNSKTNPLTQWPSSITLAVNGPGIDQTYLLNPKLQTQSNFYAGTTVPTETTWLTTLQAEKYQVAVERFIIHVPYEVQFEVTYKICDEVNGIKTCSSGTETSSIANIFHIVVKGDQTQFEVFEPNAKGDLRHTAEWSEYHSRDRYPASRFYDFYAGERILTRVQLEERHRHPFSGKHPTILSAQAWISEIGQRDTLLQSVLPLQASSSTFWSGAPQMVAKLGAREAGVDIPLMGDKQRGFQKGSSYAVYFRVQFSFGVTKGFTFPDKSALRGNDLADYRTPFAIIANAWERQGIRNHTSR
jgi:hypothetical protein